MKNTFFSRAMGRAKTTLASPARLTRFLSQLREKMNKIDWTSVSASSAVEKLRLSIRLVKAFASGAYRQVPVKTVLLLLAALIYLLNPADLIPDFLPATGLVDDFGVLAWVFRTIDAELAKFVAWENQTVEV